MASTDAREATVSGDGPMAAGVGSPTRASIGVRTLRQDRWWVYPLTTFVVFVGFIIYATFRAFWPHDYFAAPYLSPFYSPCLGDCVSGSSDFGQPFGWFPLSSALIILIFPLGFRLTCYYYRKAYYRSFWLSPPACAVSEPHKSYSGETRFPLIFNNIHRLALYFATIFNIILTYDAIRAFWGFDGRSFGMGLGTLVLIVNAVLLWLYTLSCHSCRHLIGGRINHFSKHPVRYKMWTFVSKLNSQHMVFAWVSLFGVALTDFYVRLIATGAFTDPRFF
jgi:hypothetical protein